MPINIFTYGSLMFSEVWQRVVAGRYQSYPAILHDYQRFAVRDDTYPGIVARAGSSVSGLMYAGVAVDDIVALDHFEGVDYRRIEVDATLSDGSTWLVQTYLMINPAALSEQPWMPHEFQLRKFLDTYCRNKLGS